MIFLAASFSVQAQTPACTTAQKEACQKICGTTNPANCTPAQMAACQKVCNKSASTKVAITEVLENPSILVANKTTDTKKTSCCSSAKLTSNSKPSCTAKKSTMVKNEKNEKESIAQKVVSNE